MKFISMCILCFLFNSQTIISAQTKPSYYASVIKDTARISGYAIIPKGRSYMLFIPDFYLEGISIDKYIDWYNKAEISSLVDTNIFVFVLDNCEFNFFRNKQLLKTSKDSSMFSDYYDVNTSFRNLIENTNFVIGRVNSTAHNNLVYKDKRYKDRYFDIYRVDRAYWKRYSFPSESLDIQLPYNNIAPDTKKKFTNLYILLVDEENRFYPSLDLKIRNFKMIKML